MSIFLLWQLATLACTGLLVLVVLIARRYVQPSGSEDEPAPATTPAAAALRPSALRLVMVSVADGGIVVDGIVERGHTLGWPGMPVTLVLELADPCALATVVKELQGWAAANAFVDVALFADHGEPIAALRSGHEALQLPILGVRS